MGPVGHSFTVCIVGRFKTSLGVVGPGFQSHARRVEAPKKSPPTFGVRGGPEEPPRPRPTRIRGWGGA